MHTPHIGHLPLHIGALLGVSLCASLFVTAETSAQEGWPLPHANAENTGRVAGRGQLLTPTIARAQTTATTIADARFFAYTTDANALPDIIQVIGSSVVRRRFDEDVVWDTPPLSVSGIVAIDDFNGDGTPEILALGSTLLTLDIDTGNVLWRSDEDSALRNPSVLFINTPDSSSPRILLSSTLDPKLRLYDLSQGPEPLWTNSDERIANTWTYPVMIDADADPQTLEFALVGNACTVQIFAVSDGSLLSESSPAPDDVSACSGNIQTVDIDGVPGDEVVVTGIRGNGNGFVGVFVYSPQSNTRLWTSTYAVNDGQVTANFPPRAAIDLDGDGSLELVSSVYRSADGVAPITWSLEVYNAQTGELLETLPNRALIGTAPIEGGAQYALVTRATIPTQRTLPQFNTLHIYTFLADTGLQEIDTIPNAQTTSTVLRDPQFARTFSTTTDIAPGPADTGFIAVTGGSESPVLQHITYTDGQRNVLASTAFLQPALTSTIPTTGDDTRIVLRDNLGKLRLLGTDFETFGEDTYRGSAARFLGFTQNNQATLLHTSPTGLLSFENLSPENSDTPSALFESRTTSAFIALDREGDGTVEVFSSAIDQSGSTFIQLAQVSGETLWRLNIEQASAAPYSLVRGQFGGSSMMDVAYLVNRTDGTQLAIAIDGETGDVLREHIVQVSEAGRFPNRALVVVDDLDGDGLHELVHVHRSTFLILRGSDFTILHGPHAIPVGSQRPTSYSVFQADDDPNLELYLNNQFGDKMTFDIVTGELQWSHTAPEWNTGRTLSEHGFADANGDGVWDVAIPGRHADLRVLDGRTGEELWGRCLEEDIIRPISPNEDCDSPYILSPIATADIDADGVDEWIVGTNTGWVYAVDTASGTLDWSIKLRYEVSSITVFDADDDGFLEVVASTSNSEIVTLDNAILSAPSEVRENLTLPPGVIVNAGIDIDQQSATTLLGVSWDPVEDAEGYLLSVITENDNTIINRLDVGDTTSTVLQDLTLIIGQKYTTSIVSYGQDGDQSQEVSSDGILITENLITFSDLQATPNPFNPSAAETTTLSGQIQAPSPLERVEVTILNGDQVNVFQTVQSPQTPQYALSTPWDGLREDDQTTLPDGVYDALVFALTDNGLANAETLPIEIVSTPDADVGVDTAPDVAMDTEEDADPSDVSVDADTPDVQGDVAQPDTSNDTTADVPSEENPVTVDPPSTGDDGCCSCSTVPRAPSGGLALGLFLLLGLCRIRTLRRRSRSSSAHLIAR